MTDEIKSGEELEEQTASTEENTEEKAEEKSKEEKAEARPVVFEEALEAILFAAGHPISYATLARVFEMTPGKVKDKVFEYSLRYNDPAIPRGVILLTYGDSCQLSTKQYYLNEIREALGIKRSGSLSTSSMEALAIVAYNQPVTRIFVDTLRRADSSYAMNNLLDRGLIEPKGRLDAPGRPMLYGTTSDFLRVFGLKDIYELPRTTEEMQEVFSKVRSVESTEGGVQEEMEFPEGETRTDENTDAESVDFEASAEDGFVHDDALDDEESLTPSGIEADDVIELDELEDAETEEKSEEDETAEDEAIEEEFNEDETSEEGATVEEDEAIEEDEAVEADE